MYKRQEKWDCDLEEEEEEDWDIIPADYSKLARDHMTPDYSGIYPPHRRRTPNVWLGCRYQMPSSSQPLVANPGGVDTGGPRRMGRPGEI